MIPVEAIILFPSMRPFAGNERQRIADHAQILIEPLLARAQATGEGSPLPEPVLGQRRGRRLGVAYACRV